MNPPASSSRDTHSSQASSAASSNQRVVKHKRRYCSVEGCQRIVKSQGLCQRHGAKTRKCNVESCQKQAQGNFGGMCKFHYKYQQHEIESGAQAQAASEKQAVSDYPAASEEQETLEKQAATLPEQAATLSEQAATLSEQTGTLSEHVAMELAATAPDHSRTQESSVFDTIVAESLSWKSDSRSPMPLIDHLRRGVREHRPFGWHRNAERRARGFSTVDTTAQLEEWERELVWTEVLLMAGESTDALAALSHGWGRENGFHTSIVRSVCERSSTSEQFEWATRASLLTNHGEESQLTSNITDADWAALWEDDSDEKMNESAHTNAKYKTDPD